MLPADAVDDEAVGSAARNKKRGVALSCAECRRLKLRCDRKFPCSACVKRGCSQICPDGSLTTGKGNRFVLANTETLHEKINELSHRVRALEDALSVAHKAISSDQHPLLSDELRKIKHPMERDVIAEPQRQSEEEDVIDAVGSLSISHSGRTNFYGQTANAWYLLQNEEGESPEDERSENDLPLPSDVPWLGHTFPFTPSLNQASGDAVRIILIDSLPDAENARKIAECYYENAALMYNPIPREQFDELVFSRTYEPRMDSGTVNEALESHRLAVLYAVLAVGTLVNLELPSHSPQAAKYFQLAKAALSLDSVFDEPSILAIQALLIMCHHLFLNDVDVSRWTLMGVVIKLAQAIGLHRDSTRWNLPQDETQKRRCLFWEIYVYDSWQSLTYGRPPSLSMAHIDCKMAYETSTNVTGQVEMTFEAWKHRFSSECLSIVHDQVFGARTAAYATIMELDKRVRQYYVPPSLQVPGFGGSAAYTEGDYPSPRLMMQRYVVLAIKEVTLLYMHRGFFAKAMHDHPEDPLSGKYGQSVLLAHRSASSFVSLMRSAWAQQRALLERMWFLFTHVFSCAIVLGSIPTRSPNIVLARSALQSLDQACDLFENVEEKSRAGKVLPVLRKLRERAHISMGNKDFGRRREGSSDRLIAKNDEDEFSTLGGNTRLVTQKASSPTGSSRGSRSPASSPLPARGPTVSPQPSGAPKLFVPIPPPMPSRQVPVPTSPESHLGYQSPSTSSIASPYTAVSQLSPGNPQMQPTQDMLSSKHLPLHQHQQYSQPQRVPVASYAHPTSYGYQQMQWQGTSSTPYVPEYTTNPIFHDPTNSFSVDPARYPPTDYSAFIPQGYPVPGVMASPYDGLPGAVDLDASWRSWLAEFNSS